MAIAAATAARDRYGMGRAPAVARCSPVLRPRATSQSGQLESVREDQVRHALDRTHVVRAAGVGLGQILRAHGADEIGNVAGTGVAGSVTVESFKLMYRYSALTVHFDQNAYSIGEGIV